MKNQVKALKVKIKSLMEEARIIRLEEGRAILVGHADEARKKYRDDVLYRNLRDHRVKDVRSEQRSSLLAYAYLRGRDYKIVEPNSKGGVNVGRVRDLIRKFGGRPGYPTACELDWIVKWMSGEPVPGQRTEPKVVAA